MKQGTYQFTLSYNLNNQRAHDWYTHADEADIVGTLEDAIDLASSLDCKVLLSDDSGFFQGFVKSDGEYSLK